MIKVNIKVLIVVLIMLLLVTIIILQFVAISKIKKKIVSDESKKNDILNLMMMNVMNNMNNSNSNNQIQNKNTESAQSCEFGSPQTTFFAKSIDHAEKVLMGKVYLDGYKFGSSIDLTRLDDATKKSAIVAMKYMMIDPIGARNIENRFRAIAESENVPLWFVILHESIKKLIPKDDNLIVTQLSDDALQAEMERRKLKEQNGGGKVVSINNVA